MNILSEDKSQNRIMADLNAYGLRILNQKIYLFILLDLILNLQQQSICSFECWDVCERVIGNVASVAHFAVLF
jgi:hypothetical protein